MEMSVTMSAVLPLLQALSLNSQCGHHDAVAIVTATRGRHSPIFQGTLIFTVFFHMSFHFSS